MDQFVRVRIVRGNGMDLSIFQFDYDLTFSVFFINPDKTIYGRFGTRGDYENAAKDISIEGFGKALQSALELHNGYPGNREILAPKTGPKPNERIPEAYPALKRFAVSLDLNQQNQRRNQRCIHCHQIGEAQREVHWYDREPIPDEILYPFPMPDILGLQFSPKHSAKLRQVIPGSSAEKDGFRRADEILTLGGQPIISIADVQWVLHKATEKRSLPAKIQRHGKELDLKLTLAPGWRKDSDISWRTTTRELRLVALGGMELEDMSNEERQQHKIGNTEMAMKVERVNLRTRGSNSETHAQKAGIHDGDIVIAFGERTDRMTESGIIGYVLQERPKAKSLPVKFLRNGEQMDAELSLE